MSGNEYPNQQASADSASDRASAAGPSATLPLSSCPSLQRMRPQGAQSRRELTLQTVWHVGPRTKGWDHLWQRLLVAIADHDIASDSRGEVQP